MKKICKFLTIIVVSIFYSAVSAEKFSPVKKDVKDSVSQAVEKWLQGRYKVDEVSKVIANGFDGSTTLYNDG